MVTPQPLVWDFYREAEGATDLGGVVHYFDETSQSIYLQDGIATRAAGIHDGDWEMATVLEPMQVTRDGFTGLRLDHPSNGILYGAAFDNAKLTFLRYTYGIDVSQIIDSWSVSGQSDNSVVQANCSVQNIDPEMFTNDFSLFQPGSKLQLQVVLGESEPYPMATVWLDESSFDQTAPTVTLSGRNTIGYFLKDQTFDDNTKFSGNVTDILQAILEYAGLSNFLIQRMSSENEFEFKPSDTLLSGIESILESYTTLTEKKLIAELPDGTVCIGSEEWLHSYLPRGYYTFDEGREVFQRSTVRAVDGAFTAVRVTGVDADDNDLTPVTVPVDNFPYWSLGHHRTNHLTAPDGLTQAGLQEWAEAQAKTLQYVGIAEDFTSPFRPQLVIGDIAEVVKGDSGSSLGIITQIQQSFDRKNGYRTSFSVDSGGVATDDDRYSVYSRSASVHGYNRRQSIIDLVRYTAEKTGSVDNLTAGDIGAEKKGTSSTLISQHNQNVEAHPYILGKIEDLQTKTFDLTAMGLADIPTTGEQVSVTTDMESVLSAASTGAVRVSCRVNGIDVVAVINPVFVANSSTYRAVKDVYLDALYRVIMIFSTDGITALCMAV